MENDKNQLCKLITFPKQFTDICKEEMQMSLLKAWTNDSS